MTRFSRPSCCIAKARPGAGGFTIIEMLVAMTITVLMMFLINRLFFDTVNAVSQGMALNHVLSDSQTVSQQFRSDAESMVGPSEGGFLVIINQVIPGVTIQTQKGPVTRNVRSDQLVFIRNAQGVEPLAPGNINSFSNSTAATQAKVWYGHALRTDPDGTGPATVGLGNGPNAIASDWVLGRHALFLDGTLTNPPPTSSDLLGHYFKVYAGGGVSPNLVGATFDSPVHYANTPPPVTNTLYMALTDVCAQSLASLTGPAGVLQLSDLSDPNSGPLLEDDYKNQAYLYAFPDTQISLITATQEQRLRVNPRPSGNTFKSWEIAQMHPYFVENVSDFVVEFAADADQSGDIDSHGGTGQVVWRSIGDLPTWAAGSNPNHVLSGNEARFTFRHDEPNNWPYLIRIRYRVHDPRGRFSEQVRDPNNNNVILSEPGMWFEQVIKVNRR